MKRGKPLQRSLTQTLTNLKRLCVFPFATFAPLREALQFRGLLKTPDAWFAAELQFACSSLCSLRSFAACLFFRTGLLAV
jgi:hypothetical protein